MDRCCFFCYRTWQCPKVITVVIFTQLRTTKHEHLKWTARSKHETYVWSICQNKTSFDRRKKQLLLVGEGEKPISWEPLPGRQVLQWSFTVELNLSWLVGWIPAQITPFWKSLWLYCCKCINCDKKDQVELFGCIHIILKSGSIFKKSKKGSGKRWSL